MNEGFTAAERCAERLARESEAERDARDDRDLTLGEQVLRNPLIRDLVDSGSEPVQAERAAARCSTCVGFTSCFRTWT